MQEKKKNDRRLSGFYIALCCCVLAIGAAGYVSESLSARRANSVAKNVDAPTPLPNPTAMPTAEPLPTPAEVSVFSEEAPPEILDIAELVPTAEPEEDYTFDNPDVEAVNGEAQIQDGITLPVNGEILQTYSDEPQYNRIMGDWRTHNGIDIAADEGTEIRCAADGEVKSCSSTVYGTEVVVSHSGGYETIYSQLEAADGICEGKNLRSGDVIGKITAPSGEDVSAAHVHFGVKKDGSYVDPVSALNN